MTLAVLLAAAAGALAAAGACELAAVVAGRRPRRRPGHRAAAVLALVARAGRGIGLPPPPAPLADRVAAAGVAMTAPDVMALKGGAALAGALAALPLVGLLPGRLGVAVLIAAAGCGFLSPDAWLRRRIRARAVRMGEELADVADLLRVATDAGLPVRRALAEVGRRHAGTLAGELRRAAELLELGEPRRTVLHELRRRVPLPASGALHAALDAAEGRGTPPSHALRALAADARAEATRACAERAARAAPQVQLVVALVLVPSVLLLVAAALLPMAGL